MNKNLIPITLTQNIDNIIINDEEQNLEISEPEAKLEPPPIINACNIIPYNSIINSNDNHHIIFLDSYINEIPQTNSNPSIDIPIVINNNSKLCNKNFYIFIKQYCCSIMVVLLLLVIIINGMVFNAIT